MTRRRAALALALALTSPVAAHAQSPAVPRVGVVAAAQAKDVVGRTEAFLAGMKALGYEDGRNVAIEFVYADERLDRLPALVDALVKRKVDVIVSAGPSVTRALRRATTTIPIVMAFDADPVGSGSVASLARPGGNVTGLSILATDLVGKQLEMLKAVAPKVARIVVFDNPSEPANAEVVRALRRSAASLGVAVDTIPLDDPARIEAAFAAAKRGNADAVLVLSSPLVLFHRARLAAAANATRLPAIYAFPEVVDAGGLMAYSVVFEDLFRRSATYVDRILKGAKPGELPVEQPTTFQLAVNVEAARRIGLTIPADLLARADRVVR
ncbi:MAG TPA: ABC transporter substrate-binding protein [Casimicrobiaceae bacterium]